LLGTVTETWAVLVLVAWDESPLYDAVIVAVPAVEPAKVEVHVAVPAVVPDVKLHGLGLSVPPENATVPVGAVGTVDVSVTVMEHVDAWLTTTVDGEQEMIVVVKSSETVVTLRLNVFVLPEWAMSPG
jgi:hypothetical protein